MYIQIKIVKENKNLSLSSITNHFCYETYDGNAFLLMKYCKGHGINNKILFIICHGAFTF